MNVMIALKRLINFIADPRLFFLLGALSLVLLVTKRERFAEKGWGYGLLTFLALGLHLRRSTRQLLLPGWALLATVRTPGQMLRQ